MWGGAGAGRGVGRGRPRQAALPLLPPPSPGARCVDGHVSGLAREMRETNGLLREELEGLRRRLGRQEKMQESLVVLELEKEVGPRGQWAVPCGCPLSVRGPLGVSVQCSSSPPETWKCWAAGGLNSGPRTVPGLLRRPS